MISSTHQVVHNDSAEQQRQRGKELRAAIPRKRLAEFSPAADRDPLAILAEQNRGRLQPLVPVRFERMSESPFAFYRGAAAVMAADLAGTPSTGVYVQACGDAHLSNFGVYAAPDRELIFDLNDFDETTPGPWEWDVKRLVSSIVLAGEQQNLSAKDLGKAAVGTAAAYRISIRRLATMPALDRYYQRISKAEILRAASSMDQAAQQVTAKTLRKAERNTSERALKKLAIADVEGGLRIVEQPPLVEHLPIFDVDRVRPIVEAYLRSVSPDIAALLSLYRFQDAAMRVVGVGSVGTRCAIVLLTDPSGSPLFLQLKEANSSVLERFAGASSFATPGERVVAGQRMMQAASDPFLGWFSAEGVAFYVRQFRDMKGSIDLALLQAKSLLRYGELCARALARAHSQLGAAATIGAYLGAGETADHALAEFGERYAEITRLDHAKLLAQSSDASEQPEKQEG
ncbi:DUF2252 domain-containing protein [Psychromicrobium lacuslunae]|uniref:DUF2252 domain-containing protein n=1 Tax=Psychromicrobium lacuslunae TaxID=1618207 RepID=A0A0D4BX44_9MICC|nr:DUF2252 domain-containing protein [Psychromicrobium lacuslunae]AJT40695.1 hypothetical protein UM93_02675 [Psychromicrobium lacuslunae]